jgi:hypothetical protein
MSAARSTSLLFEIEIFAAAIVLEAAKTMNVSVKLDHLLAAGARVKPINILGDEQKLWRALFHLG